MSTPLIGLNCDVTTEEHDDRAGCLLTYIDAIAAAGGAPVLLPAQERPGVLTAILDRLDGLCLIGGKDIHPDAYGGHPQAEDLLLHPRRHRSDLALAVAALARPRLPILGICGGHQLLVVAHGGALVQDIASAWPRQPALPHALNQRDGDRHWHHSLRLDPGSRLATIVGGDTLLTNSFHHQAADPERLDGLRPTAWTEDGIIEAVETADDRFVFGVQWHPERSAEEPASRRLFQALVAGARG